LLARPERHRCIECGTPFGAAGFACYHGILEEGPAYWSDRGILCSPACAGAHHARRVAEGSVPDRPADPPFDLAELIRHAAKV
jgi:hypothetical protein